MSTGAKLITGSLMAFILLEIGIVTASVADTNTCKNLGYQSGTRVNFKLHCETMINGSYVIIPIENLRDNKRVGEQMKELRK